MICQSKGLEHRFDPRLSSIKGAREVDRLTVKNYLAASLLPNPCDLTHEGGFTCPVVTHNGHVFAFA